MIDTVVVTFEEVEEFGIVEKRDIPKVALDPAVEQGPSVLVVVLVEFDHRKTSRDRVIEFVDRPVRHVHRADDAQTLVEFDGFAVIGLDQGLVSVLDGGIEWPEYL